MHVIFKTDGPDKPAITLTPNKPVYAVEDQLTIQCISDSNPPPVFTWSFKPHNKSRDTRIKHSNDSSKLVFSSLKIEDSGIYICTVNNSARPHFLNTSANFSVLPKILERENSGCNQCGYIETCQQDDEKTVCIVNIWLPIAVVFILLSAAFAVSSVVMIRQRNRAQENTATNNILTENRYVVLDPLFNFLLHHLQTCILLKGIIYGPHLIECTVDCSIIV